MIESIQSSSFENASNASSKLSKVREISEKLEATFISEMLKSAKFGETPEAFGGGIGEDQFSSFLRQAYSEEMAKAGGVGLAENLFIAMTKSMGIDS